MAKTSASILILGAGGDLTKRLLLPGLASLLQRRDDDVQVIGSGLDERSDSEWRAIVESSFAAVGGDPQAILRRSAYIRADATDPAELRRLLDACAHPPVIYFALPPARHGRGLRGAARARPARGHPARAGEAVRHGS